MGIRDALAAVGFRDTGIDRLDRAVSVLPNTRAIGDTLAPSWAGKASWPAENILVLTRDGYRKCVTAFASINLIADAVAEATLRVYEDQGEGDREELIDHPLRLLMQRPNPGKSESELLGLTIRHAAIAGFSVLEKVRSARGNVVQLWHLNPAQLKPVYRDQAPPDWDYTVVGHPSSPFRLKAEDVVVFTYMDDVSLGVTGDTPLRAIMRQAGILHALTDFVKLLLDRGGVPPIVLIAEPIKDDFGDTKRKLSDAEIEAIREQWLQRYGGYTNWTGPAVIEGVRLERIGLNLNELAFEKLRDVIDLDVCRAFRIPPILVQVQAGIESSYGLMYEQSMRAMQLYTASPLRARLDGTLTRSLLPEIDPRPNVSLEFDTSRVISLQEDADAVHNRARADFQAGGLKFDEFRQRIGAEPIGGEFGESVMLPFSVVPTPVTGLPEPDPEPDERGGGYNGHIFRSPTSPWESYGGKFRALISPPPYRGDGVPWGEPNLDRIRHARTMLGRGPEQVIPATDEDVDRHAVNMGAMLRGFPPDTDPIFRASAERMFRGAVGASNQAAIVRIGTRYAPPLRTFWRKQGERILQSIIDLTGARSAWDGWLAELAALDARHSVAVHRHSAENVSVRAAEFVDWEGEDRLLAEVMTRLHNGTGKAAWQAIAKQLDADGIVWDMANPNVRAILRDLAQRIVGINDTTRDDVRRVLADALDEGVTLDELSKRFRGLFEETYKSRAMTVARTETQVAYNTASVAGYRETGVVDSAQLMDNSMHDTDPGSDGLTCAQRDGLVVPLDEVGRHIEAEHPNGTLAVAPVLATPLGTE